jgi:hypothetical protein
VSKVNVKIRNLRVTKSERAVRVSAYDSDISVEYVVSAVVEVSTSVAGQTIRTRQEIEIPRNLNGDIAEIFAAIENYVKEDVK